MHVPEEVGRFFSLKNIGLIIGYSQFFLSAIYINCWPGLMILNVIMAITLSLSVLWIYGILADEPTSMRPSLVWAKYVYVFCVIFTVLTLIVEVYWCVYAVFIWYGWYAYWRANRTFFYLVALGVATVVQDYLTTQMDALYKSMKNAAEHHEELPDATMAGDYTQLHTFWLVSAVAELIADYTERIYDKVKNYSKRFQEFLSREWDVLFNKSNANTPARIMKSQADQIEKEENENLKNNATTTIIV